MSLNRPQRLDVELCSLQLTEAGDGFVMDLVCRDQPPLRLEFPDWIVPQLMRSLPRIAAQLRAGSLGPAPVDAG